MKNEAVKRIKSMVTPKITLDACHDTPGGIKAEIRYTYSLCAEKGVEPTHFAKVFTVLADKKGAVYFYPGLFH